MVNSSGKKVAPLKTLAVFQKIVHPTIGILFILLFLGGITSDRVTAQTKNNNPNGIIAQNAKNYKVIFVELGSVRCIPCKQMQTVMKSIEKKYGTQVKVIFHDVWTPEGKPFAEQFKIDAIPTQVFLDGNGKEYYRHEGFFPEKELVKLLQQKGVK